MKTTLSGNAARGPAACLHSWWKRHRRGSLPSAVAAILLGAILGAQSAAAAIASFSFPDFANASGLQTFKNA